MGETPARPPPARGLVGVVALLHLAWLLALPALGFTRLIFTPSGGSVLFAWVPVLIYVLLMLSGYHLTRHPLRALAVLGAVPLQVGIIQLLWGGDFFDFVYESAVLEVGALMVALAIAMLVYRPSGIWGSLAGVGFAAAFVPYCMPLIRQLPTWPITAQLLLVSSLATAVWPHAVMVATAARNYNEGEGSQRASLGHGKGESVSVDLTTRSRRVALGGVVAVLVISTFVGFFTFEYKPKVNPWLVKKPRAEAQETRADGGVMR